MIAEVLIRTGVELWTSAVAAFAAIGLAPARAGLAHKPIIAERKSVASSRRPAEAPMGRQAHWERIEREVRRSITAAETAHSLHGEAGRQLDAVDYAYHRMIAELADYLPVGAAAAAPPASSATLAESLPPPAPASAAARSSHAPSARHPDSRDPLAA
ncbi:MAG: hypothetical protein NW205_02540 [Hyphomicrobiaceae bacterium]|nr:hypothetical protein [Hyphomicrobiaceae bacterium]